MQNANAIRNLFVTAATAMTLGACATSHPMLETGLVKASSQPAPISDTEFNRQVASGKLLADATFDTAECKIAADPKNDMDRQLCSIIVKRFNQDYNNYIQNYGATAAPVSTQIAFMLKNKEIANNNLATWTNDGIALQTNNIVTDTAAPVAQASMVTPSDEKYVLADQEAKFLIVQNTRSLTDITDGKTFTKQRGVRVQSSPLVLTQTFSDSVAANTDNAPTPAVAAKPAVDTKALAAAQQKAAAAAKKAADEQAKALQKQRELPVELGGFAVLCGSIAFAATRIRRPKTYGPLVTKTSYKRRRFSKPGLIATVAPRILTGLAVGAGTAADRTGEVIKVVAPRILVGLAAGGGTALAFGAVTTVVGLSLIAAPVTMGVAGAVGLGMLGGALSGGAGSVAVHHVFDKNRTKASYLKAFGIGAVVGGALGGALGFLFHAVNGAHAGVTSALHHGAAQAPVAHTAPVSAPVHTAAPTAHMAAPVSHAPTAPVAAPHVTTIDGVNFTDAQMQHLSSQTQNLLHSTNAHSHLQGLKDAGTELTRMAEHAKSAAEAAQNFATEHNILTAGQSFAQQHHLAGSQLAHQISRDLGDKAITAMAERAQHAVSVANIAPRLG